MGREAGLPSFAPPFSPHLPLLWLCGNADQGERGGKEEKQGAWHGWKQIGEGGEREAHRQRKGWMETDGAYIKTKFFCPLLLFVWFGLTLDGTESSFFLLLYRSNTCVYSFLAFNRFFWLLCLFSARELRANWTFVSNLHILPWFVDLLLLPLLCVALPYISLYRLDYVACHEGESIRGASPMDRRGKPSLYCWDGHELYKQ